VALTNEEIRNLQDKSTDLEAAKQKLYQDIGYLRGILSVGGSITDLNLCASRVCVNFGTSVCSGCQTDNSKHCKHFNVGDSPDETEKILCSALGVEAA
jgi:hypothetical protein